MVFHWLFHWFSHWLSHWLASLIFFTVMVNTRQGPLPMDRLEQLERMMRIIIESLPQIQAGASQPAQPVQQEPPVNAGDNVGNRQGNERDAAYLYE